MESRLYLQCRARGVMVEAVTNGGGLWCPDGWHRVSGYARRCCYPTGRSLDADSEAHVSADEPRALVFSMTAVAASQANNKGARRSLCEAARP